VCICKEARDTKLCTLNKKTTKKTIKKVKTKKGKNVHDRISRI
jgi:hypothetical protein